MSKYQLADVETIGDGLTETAHCTVYGCRWDHPGPTGTIVPALLHVTDTGHPVEIETYGTTTILPKDDAEAVDDAD